LIVHDGVVDLFKRSLDDYPAWLKEQEPGDNKQSDDTATDSPTRSINRKQQRQQQAQRRQRLKPLYDKIRDIEEQLAARRADLEALDLRLADATIYTDPQRKDELSQIVQNQATLKSEIEALEWNWLDASETLEKTS